MTVAEKLAATRLDIEDGLAHLVIDCPESKLNVLSPTVFEELGKRFEELSSGQEQVRALLITSAKKGSFVAGADINTLAAITDPEEGARMSREAQEVFGRLADLSIPTLCAIDGVCLGGGLELALATNYRLVSDSSATALGLPEVQLGLIPGAGGTQRLPRLIGLPDALDMILTGRNIRPNKARKMGLADEVVPVHILEQRALQAARELSEGQGMAFDILSKRQKKLSARVAESFGVRSALYSQVKADLRKKTGGHYPAPFKALEAARAAVSKSAEEGLELEARLFGEAATTPESKALIHLFCTTTALKSHKVSKEKPRTVKRTAVLGGGLMGSGIATMLADMGLPVRIKDVDKQSLGRSLGYAYKVYNKNVNRRRLREFDRDLRMARLAPSLDYSGFGKADIVIEAVFEDLDLKHRVLAEVEEATNDQTIFASNTSSLPIADIASRAKRPQNVIGMHFFSPVEKMKLVEVIVTPDTAEWVTATTVALARKMKKHVIVVGDGAGFYTSRVLAAFVGEALRALYDGAAIEAIDKALGSFGFPVGPMVLLDEVGIDVVTKVMKIMSAHFPGRFDPPENWEELVEGRLGKKNKRGFYRHSGRTKEPDHTIYDKLPGGRKRKSFPMEQLQDRCVYAFLNEAALCLQQEILRSPRDGDVGAIFGLGFPPFLGGPFHFMDRLGVEAVVGRLRELEQAHGAFFAPAPLLVDMASEGTSFF